jgi:hypothetical protein
MFIISKGQSQARFNKPIYGLTGTYTLSEGVSLPYFTALLEVDRAIDELRIAEQVPPTLETQWSLKELFQREIDETRVKNDIIKGYLLDPKKLKFFNAITIVLMPKSSDARILDTFDESEPIHSPSIPWDSSDTEDAQWNQEGAKITNFGGVQFVSIGLSARLRWDEDRVLAVAVDGQHRLWALRTFREDPKFRGGTLRSTERLTKIPVIFILLHSEAGFQNNQDQTDYSIRGISRELFTDLNKNAKTVDRARELILDDRSINARCVRTLLTEKTAEDSNNLVPISLVRWQDDSNRFDTSYYLNSLVHLDLLVSDLLDLNPPRDPMEKNQVMAFIKSVNLTLGIDGQEVEHESRLLSKYYLEDCCDDEGEPHTPFSRLPDNYLESAVEGFKVNFRPWLLKLLLEFKPYKNLLTYARQNNLIEGTFGSFQAQTSKHKAIVREQETTRDSDWHTREILKPQEEIGKMKDEQWAFKAIFQKAMVRLGKTVEFQYKDEHLGSINDLITFLDRLYDEGVLKVYALLPDHPFRLWTFVALNPGNDKIKVAKTVEDKIFSLLCLWYFGSRKLQLDAVNNIWHTSARKLLNFFSADKNTAQWPDCKKCFETLQRGFDTNAFYGRDADQLTEKQKDELVRSRFAAVFEAGLPPFPQPNGLSPDQSEVASVNEGNELDE